MLRIWGTAAAVGLSAGVWSWAPSKAEGGPATSKSVYKDTNAVPRTQEGKVLHVDVGPQEVAPRIVTVGAASRARLLAGHFDGVNGQDPQRVPGVLYHESSRGFTTYTGTVDGVPLSVIAIGMGMPMMDFMIREIRSIVEGPMIMVRYGTCGGLQEQVPEGTVVVAALGSVSVTRNPDSFAPASIGLPSPSPYNISGVAPADVLLSNAVGAELSSTLKREVGVQTMFGMNVTADSFYGSQARKDPNFDDRGDGLLESLLSRYPGLMTMEMETFQLFDLARSATQPIKAAAAAIVVANRPTGAIMDGITLKSVESLGGKAIMKAVAHHPLD